MKICFSLTTLCSASKENKDNGVNVKEMKSGKKFIVDGLSASKLILFIATPGEIEPT